jgi:hypothetical protein
MRNLYDDAFVWDSPWTISQVDRGVNFWVRWPIPPNLSLDADSGLVEVATFFKLTAPPSP